MLTDEMKAQGWVEHDGGPCPVGRLSPVSIILRGGETTFWPEARSVVWEYGTPIWEAGGEPLPELAEVIAYKVEQPNG